MQLLDDVKARGVLPSVSSLILFLRDGSLEGFRISKRFQILPSLVKKRGLASQ